MGRHSAPSKRELRRQAALAKAAEQESAAAEVSTTALVPRACSTTEVGEGDGSRWSSAPAEVGEGDGPRWSSAPAEVGDGDGARACSTTEVGDGSRWSSSEGAPAPERPSRPLDETPATPVTVAAGATAMDRPRSLGPVRRMPRRIAIGAAIAMLTAGMVGFVGLGKSVTIKVDGDPVSVTTYASDVDGALQDAGVSTSAEDEVTPSLSSDLSDGETVEVVRARELTLDIDGTATTETVTALTADEALDQLGLQGYAIASGKDDLPLKGASLELSAPKTLTIKVDGETSRVVSAATTVDGVLDEAGIELGTDDTTTPERAAKPTDGATITVTRNDISVITEERDLPFTTVEQSNADEYVGIDSVASEGANGKAKVTVEVKSVDGVQVSKTDLSTEIVTAPVDRVILKGAKQFPADVEAMNWDALAMCESTMNPKAVNKTNGKYFGLYQFSVETWAGVGGTGNPMDASVEEQTARAKILFMKYGASQWECGSHLYD